MVSIFLCSRTYTCISFLQNVQKCHETCQDRMDRQLSWQIKSTNGFAFLWLKWKKQINEVSPWFCFALLSLQSFCWPFCSCAPSLCYRPAKQVKKWNANADICSSFGRLFAWLPANIWNILFAFHVTPMSSLHFPYLLWASFYLPFFCLWFHYISHPDDLTFKWQLFPDLFRKLPSCLVVPAGTSEASCLTDSISRQNSHVGASFGNRTRLECRIVWVHFSTAPGPLWGYAWWRRVTVWQRVKLDSGFRVMLA